MTTSLRDAMIERATADLGALELSAEDGNEEHMERLRRLVEHLRDGIPSPLVYEAAADFFPEWKG